MSHAAAAVPPERRRETAYVPRERCDYEPRANFTRMDNGYWDELVGYLPPQLLILLGVIYRQTVGWHEQYALISDEWMARLATDRATFSRNLAELIRLKLISGRRSTRGDGRQKEYRVHPEHFKTVGERAKKRHVCKRAKRKPVEKAAVSAESLTTLSTISALRVRPEPEEKEPEARVSCPLGLPCPHPETALGKLVSISPPGEGPPAEKSLTTLSTTSPQPAESKDSDREALRRFLGAQLRRHGQAPDNNLLDGILARLRGCALDTYKRVAAEALSKTGVRNAKGLAMRVAEQCAEAHAASLASAADAKKEAELDARARQLLPGRDYSSMRLIYEDAKREGNESTLKWLRDNFPELEE